MPDTEVLEDISMDPLPEGHVRLILRDGDHTTWVRVTPDILRENWAAYEAMLFDGLDPGGEDSDGHRATTPRT